ncbi:OmpA family protein [Sulfitobacter sp. 1151]|uniref:OmpA family protein n=1 Tax=Parasulfitobacter algicola TaxID=2614809 RepID=A0ABX2INZ8_9RHOB|nr:OmpA family protein [Sulfitobacter algicola]
MGGPDASITLYVPQARSNTWVAFDNTVMRAERARLNASANVLETNAEVADALASDNFGIGVTTYSKLGNAQPMTIGGTCGIRTEANPFTIKTEEYPLAFRLYTYKNATRSPAVVDSFLNFLDTNAAEEILRENGFVSEAAASVKVNEQGNRFASIFLASDEEMRMEDLQVMMQSLIAAERLSITFRFEQGGASLDGRALSDLDQLAKLIADGSFNRKDILLVGFTDSVGPGELNQLLSQQRAEEVRNELLQRLPQSALSNVNIISSGYGEVSPLGCNETFNGRRINRRVEVWVR